MEVIIIGAGLAGSEAALQLAKRNIKVKLYEMRPQKTTGAHVTENCAEFVCSNSLGSADITNASGLLKAEMQELGGELIKIAYECRVPAGNALAIDRVGFSKKVTELIENNENIEFIREELKEIPSDKPVIIASGPLTSDDLANKIQEFTKSEHLHFFDAIAPIVEKDSINFDIAFWASRYDKGEASYINCPMDKDQYTRFYEILTNAERIELKEFEKDAKFFESCLPVEVLASRGVDTLRFGPMKPVGLIDKRTGVENWAVVQLRQDNAAKSLFNLVGFQTNLKFGEQKRVFSLIPALKNAEFIRYGEMHRNTFINAPNNLTEIFQLKKYPNIFIAGQLSGVEGYVESISSGLYAGINMYNYINNLPPFILPNYTCIGGLPYFITNAKSKHFQPMNTNFGVIMSNIGLQKCKNKVELVENSLNYINKIKGEINGTT